MSIIKNILKRILSSIQMVNTLLQGHQLFTLNPAFRIANGHIKHFQKNVSFLGPVSPILKTRKFYLLLSILSTDNKSRSHSNSVLVARFQILSPERILWGSVACIQPRALALLVTMTFCHKRYHSHSQGAVRKLSILIRVNCKGELAGNSFLALNVIQHIWMRNVFFN